MINRTIASFILDEPLRWQLRAMCAQTDPEIFYPTKGRWFSIRDARKVCSECPVKTECLDYALANGEVYGIWGGTTYRQRRKMPGWTPREGEDVA